MIDGRMRKRSVTVAGHRTSVTLEAPFWEVLKGLARARGESVNALVAAVDRDRRGSLSGALRVFVLEAVKEGHHADQGARRAKVHQASGGRHHTNSCR